jgi:hypothetical protein
MDNPERTRWLTLVAFSVSVGSFLIGLALWWVFSN